MKLKKMTIKAPAAAAAPAAGGAAIADRFKLDPLDNGSSKRAGTTSKKPAVAALIVGMIALVISVILTVTIWKHWEYLMSA